MIRCVASCNDDGPGGFLPFTGHPRVQVWRMDPPVCLPNEEHLWGCFSWIDIPAANGWDTCGALALEDSEFGVQQATLRAALQHVEVEAIECLSEK